MIFHSPVPLDPSGNSGSHLRPIQMLKAFKDLGYEVFEISGYGKERWQALKKLKSNIKNGISYEFLYSESSTMPMFLTEKHHLPTYAFVEIILFKLCKKNLIPCTLFYRDVHWKFNIFQTGTSNFKKLIAIFFYLLELLTYKRYISVLFLPSLQMKKTIPIKFKNSTIFELPPGVPQELVNFKKNEENQKDKINLIYVGGVIPPLYDIRWAIKQVAKLKKVNLKIICRKKEWEKIRGDIELPDNVFVDHISGKQLEDEYKKSDVSLVVLGRHPYAEFSMPIKLFEAIAFSTPVIILSSMHAAASLVKEHNLGYVIQSEGGLAELLEDILEDKANLKMKYSNNNSYKKYITWSHRAKEVEEAVNQLAMR